ncbi:TldD/PmbA family protein [Dermatobacter hominis]|uniref:TldD/PmbA family protein n=1 Tax=Dermatobacter hominis TaxID=2884263 RepID=UPI001D110FF7|nr:TldD/PmbA family protein [Dermatobacter hominis]UDY34856.1 TldD/PmbA family protein [Dermatobacter hominis]
MTPEELLSVADGVVGRAKPGEELEAVVTWSHDTEIRAADGEVEHFVESDAAGLGVRIVRDGRTGVAWVGSLGDEAAIEECIVEARDNAEFGTPDPHAGLAVPDGVAAAALDLFDDRLERVPTAAKIELAVDLERRILDADPRMVGLEASDYADAVSAGAIATTTGIRVCGADTSAYVGAWALAEDDSGTTTGFGFSVGRTTEDLLVEPAAADAVRRCLTMLGASKAPSERLTVVLDPYVTSQFLGLVAELLSGEAVLRGRSAFAGRVGEQVASPLVTLVDDPTDALAPSADDTDGEGLACRPVDLLSGGVLQGYLHNAYTARATGTTSTGSAQRGSHRSVPGVGPRVAKLLGGSGTSEQVIAAVGDGLLVQEVAGLHSGVNPVSGDLSVGVEGVRIRGGELAESIREVTIGSTLQRMLLDVQAVGADLTYFPWDAAGVTLAIADVTMSGT